MTNTGKSVTFTGGNMTISARPRTKSPEERREELLNAAENVFLENGVAKATIDQITARAGVAKGTFYLYFSTKEDIYHALCEQFVERYLKQINTAIAERPPEDHWGQLETWTQRAVLGLYENGAIADVLFHDYPQIVDWENQIRMVQPLIKLLEDGCAHNAWHLDDARFIAVFIFTGLHGVVDDALRSVEGKNAEDLVERVNRIVYQWLRIDSSR